MTRAPAGAAGRHRLTAVTSWDVFAPLRERRQAWIDGAGLPVTEWLIAALAPRPRETVLELAAGAGGVGFTIVERTGGQVRLISTDVSSATVEVARRVAATRGLSEVKFRTIDGQAIEMPSASVDAVICRWGYMLMDDPLSALRETCRVLRAGGRVAFSVWGQPARNPWTTIDADICRRLGYVAPVPPTHAGEIFSLADAGRLRSLVEKSGLAVHRMETVGVTWPYATASDYVDVEINRPGARGDFFRSLPDSRRDLAAILAGELLEPFCTRDGYLVPGETLNVLASRASPAER